MMTIMKTMLLTLRRTDAHPRDDSHPRRRHTPNDSRRYRESRRHRACGNEKMKMNVSTFYRKVTTYNPDVPDPRFPLTSNVFASLIFVLKNALPPASG